MAFFSAFRGHGASPTCKYIRPHQMARARAYIDGAKSEKGKFRPFLLNCLKGRLCRLDGDLSRFADSKYPKDGSLEL